MEKLLSGWRNVREENWKKERNENKFDFLGETLERWEILSVIFSFPLKRISFSSSFSGEEDAQVPQKKSEKDLK